jgi:ribonuclease P protein component
VPPPHPALRPGRARSIRKHLEFQRAQGSGRRVTTSHFVLVLYSREAGSLARLGIVASRKIGNAVTRNRAKRLVREAFRKTSDLFSPGIDLVVIVRRPLHELKLDDVVAEWRAVASVVKKRTAEAATDRAARAPAAPAGVS